MILQMKNILLTFLLMFLSLQIFAQEKDFPINISIFNESTAIPFTKVFTTPVHPGIQIGTEFNYTNKVHSRFLQTINISYFYHNHLAQGIGLNTELGYEYRLKFGFAFESLLGVGYMHTFATSDEFTFSNGEYIKKVDKGNSRFYPSLSLDIGYYLNKNKNSPKIFIRYQSWVEYPYSPGFIDIMSHVNIHIGTKIFI